MLGREFWYSSCAGAISFCLGKRAPADAVTVAVRETRFVLMFPIYSGTENATDIRGPFDVINMGQLLNLSAEQVLSTRLYQCWHNDYG